MEAGSKDHYQCSLCEKYYIYPGTLKVHMIMNHSEAESYTCNQCDFIWRRIEDLKTHTQIHIKETPKICNVSEFQCGTLGDMDEHIATIHRENEVTTDRREAGHFRKKSGEKYNKCNQCDFASAYAHSLRDI